MLIDRAQRQQPVVVEGRGFLADRSDLLWMPLRPSGSPMPGVGIMWPTLP